MEEYECEAKWYELQVEVKVQELDKSSKEAPNQLIWAFSGQIREIWVEQEIDRSNHKYELDELPAVEKRWSIIIPILGKYELLLRECCLWNDLVLPYFELRETQEFKIKCKISCAYQNIHYCSWGYMTYHRKQ